MEGKTAPQAAPAFHFPKEAGLHNDREPFLKGPERIIQLPGIQHSFPANE